MDTFFSHIDTPFGMATCSVDAEGSVLAFGFINEFAASKVSASRAAIHDPSRLKDVTRQVHEFFDRKRTSFTLNLKFVGSDFQRRVWASLIDIPFGETISYQTLAIKVGDYKASRAVGGANNKNPIALIVPCHRVIGKNGSLTGYAGGIALKQQLLDFESPLLF